MMKMVKRKATGKSTSSSDTEKLLMLTVAELRKQCKEQGLDTSGNKQQLITRLQDECNTNDDGPPKKLSKQTTIQKAMAIVDVDLSGKKQQKKNIVHKIDQFCTIDGQGEPGANAIKGPFADATKAIADFKKKFKEKTKNDWDNRSKFKAVPGKYTLLEMEEADQKEQHKATSSKKSLHDSNLPQLDYFAKGCSLDKPTQDLLQLVFDHDMFKNTMASMNLDMQKMPLGKLSKAQVMKGFEVLDQIQNAIESNGSSKRSQLEELSSTFYTLIPHDFGRQRPPLIDTKELLKQKADLLVTLGDIAEALGMQKQQEILAKSKVQTGKHALDMQYELLDCKLDLVDPSVKEYKVIQKYFDATKRTHVDEGRAARLGGKCWARKCNKFVYLWKVDRKHEVIFL